MNTLERIRLERKLTYTELGALVGYPRNSTWRHCHMGELPKGAAARYACGLGVDPALLRSDVLQKSPAHTNPATAE